MNEETIEFRLDQIDKKIDQLTELVTQTATQEVRIKTLENRMDKNIDRWLSPLVSAGVSGIVAFIFFKVGLK